MKNSFNVFIFLILDKFEVILMVIPLLIRRYITITKPGYQGRLTLQTVARQLKRKLDR